MEINTEIYLSDLTEETKEGLTNAIIDRLKDDKDEMELIEVEVLASMEDDDIEPSQFEETKNWRIKETLEDKAKKILENTFWAECNIGDEIGL